MMVDEALKKIRAPKGVTSVLADIMSGDFNPIRDQSASGTTRAVAEQKLFAVQMVQNNCKSDWAYWGYAGDIAYWTAVVDILKAAELVGPTNLPDVPAPDLEGCVVMDACSNVERFGREVRRRAEEKYAWEPMARPEKEEKGDA